jgi:hypothetical protein
MSVTIDELLLLSAIIAIGFLVAVAFYESLSTRDVLVARVMRFARRRADSPRVTGAAYLLTVAAGIPVLVVIWAAVLDIALFFVGSVDRIASTSLIAVSVVGAARILAYVREKTAHELAKAIPLSFAFLLLTGGALNLEQKLARVAERPDTGALTAEMLAFLVLLEVGMRLLTDGSQAVLRANRRRHGITGDLGVWRTIWAGLRGPRPSSGEVAIGEASGSTPPNP